MFYLNINRKLEEECSKICSQVIQNLKRFCNVDEPRVENIGEEELETLLTYVKYFLKQLWSNFYSANVKLTTKVKEWKMLTKNLKFMVHKLDLYIEKFSANELVVSYLSILIQLYLMKENRSLVTRVLLKLFRKLPLQRKIVFMELVTVFKLIKSKNIVKLYANDVAQLLILLINSLSVEIQKSHAEKLVVNTVEEHLKPCREAIMQWSHTFIMSCDWNNREDYLCEALEIMISYIITHLNTNYAPVAHFILITMLYFYIRLLIENKNFDTKLVCFILDVVTKVATALKNSTNRTNDIEFCKMKPQQVSEIDLHHQSVSSSLRYGNKKLKLDLRDAAVIKNEISTELCYLYQLMEDVSEKTADNDILKCSSRTNRCVETCFRFILRVLLTSTILNIRIKAMKCVLNFAESTKEFFVGNNNLKQFISGLILDRSSVIREYALNIISKINCVANYFEYCYEDILTRTLDINVGVRKSANILLQQMYTECNDESKRTMIVIRMFRCLSDPNEALQNIIKENLYKNLLMYNESDEIEIMRKVEQMYHLALWYNNDFKIWFHVILSTINDKGDTPSVHFVIHRFIEVVVDKLDKLKVIDETSLHLEIITLISKVQASLLISYTNQLTAFASNLISIENSMKENVKIIKKALEILKNIESIKPENENFEKFKNYILTKISPNCLEASILILVYLSKTISLKDFDPLQKIYTDYFNYLVNETKKVSEHNTRRKEVEERICKIIYILSEIIDKFDFKNNPNFMQFITKNPKLYVHFENMILHWIYKQNDFQTILVRSLGQYCKKNSAFIRDKRIINIYKAILKNENQTVSSKIQVIINLTNRLNQTNDDLNKISMSQIDSLNLIHSKPHMTDIIYPYFVLVMKCYPHQDDLLRYSIAVFIRLVYNHGLVNPVEIIPHIVAMTTDIARISDLAKSVLKSMVETYATMVFSTIKESLNFTFTTRSVIQIVNNSDKHSGVTAVNQYFFFILHSINRCRKLFLSTAVTCLQQEITDIFSLEMRLFHSENFAYFDYNNMSSVLYVISVLTNLIISFQDRFNEHYKMVEDKSNKAKENCENTQRYCEYNIIGYLILIQLKNYLIAEYSVSVSMLTAFVKDNNHKFPNKKKKNAEFDLSDILYLISEEKKLLNLDTGKEVVEKNVNEKLRVITKKILALLRE